MKLNIDEIIPEKIRYSNTLWFLIFFIFLTNLTTLFRFANIYWWSMYFGVILILILWLLRTKPKLTVRTIFRTEINITILFISLGLLSTLLNMANPLHAIYVIFLRLTPLLVMGYAIYYSLQDKHNIFKHKKYITGFFYIFLLVSMIVASYQHFVQGKIIDDVTSILGDAHAYSFLSLFLSFYFLLNQKSKIATFFFLFIFLSAVYICYKADFKLGLMSFAAANFAVILLEIKKSLKILVVAVGVFALAIVIVFFDSIIENLPSTYSFFIILATSDNLWNLDSTFPPDLELFKGYYQIFSRIFDSPQDYLFGVGPGNYGSNIAKLTRKPLAVEHIIYYRDILDQKGAIYGTLLNRFNSFINLIAEFGILGTVVYTWALTKILFFLRKVFKTKNVQPYKTKGVAGQYYFINVFAFFILIEFPIFGAIEEGLYVTFFAIIFGLTGYSIREALQESS